MAKESAYTLGDRLAAIVLAIVFAVPTAFIVWFLLNLEMASFNGFLSSSWLWGFILLFISIGFVAPRVFIDILGALWRVLHYLAKWWH